MSQSQKNQLFLSQAQNLKPTQGKHFCENLINGENALVG